jgi:hypothetical protein
VEELVAMQERGITPHRLPGWTSMEMAFLIKFRLADR